MAEVERWQRYVRIRDTVINKQQAVIAELVNLSQSAFMQGYESGHHDTVESQYGDAEESYNDWINDWIREGNCPSIDMDLVNKHKGGE